MVSFLRKKSTPSMPRGIIYGDPGSRKSTFGASIPDSIIIDCENSLTNINTPHKTDHQKTWLETERTLKSILNEKHDYKVVVIDTIDWLLQSIELHVSGVTAGEVDKTINKSHGGFGNGYQVLKNYVYQKLFPIFNALTEKGITVIMLAHTQQSKISTNGVEAVKIVPNLPERLLNIIIEWVDFIFLIRKTPQGKYKLITTPQGNIVAKNRYRITNDLDFDWGSVSRALQDGINKEFKL